jgi:hypothetical protein
MLGGQKTFVKPACADFHIVVKMAVLYLCVCGSKLIHAITSLCMYDFQITGIEFFLDTNVCHEILFHAHEQGHRVRG